MRRRPLLCVRILCSALLITSAVACKDYGEFTVVDRQWVEDDEFPALSEIDLTGINLEFAVGSEAHARVLPEADWPDPVGMLLDRMKSENGGTLPPDFDLPLEDGCIYVGAESLSSRFRRVQFKGRTLLFVTYRVGTRKSGLPEEEQPEVELRLAILDESQGMKRHDLRLGALKFDLIRTDSHLAVVSVEDRSVYLRRILLEDGLVVGEPSLLNSFDHRIDRMTVVTEPNGQFHIALLLGDRTATAGNSIYYSKYRPNAEPIVNSRMLSRDARAGFLAMRLRSAQTVVIWTDSRFARYGFSPSNISKIFANVIDTETGSLRAPQVLNLPFQDSDDAYLPIFVNSVDEGLLLQWRADNGGDINGSSMRSGVFNLNDFSISLGESKNSKDEIVSAALQQRVDLERSTPVERFPVSNPAQCDNWQEHLNLEPTGFGIMTPEGEQPITRLGTEENGDNDQD